MTRCRNRYDVSALLLGALTPAEEAGTLVHVAGCTDCQQVLADFTARPDLLARIPLSMLAVIERSQDAPRSPPTEPKGQRVQRARADHVGV
jgi:hypothetical protein